MSTWQWYGEETREELGEAWGVSSETVKHYSAEASRQLRGDPTQIEEDILISRSWSDKIRREALEKTNLITGLPDFGSALKANEQVVQFTKLLVPEEKPAQQTPIRVEVVMTDEDKPE